MKLTKAHLKKIIQEEVTRSLTESDYEEERMPDAEIFRRMANDLRTLDPNNYPALKLKQVVELLMQQEDFQNAWDQLLRDEEYEESSS